jgi:dihydroneopterin aldolase
MKSARKLDSQRGKPYISHNYSNMPINDIIRIKNASFYAYHGVASDEQNLGGRFEVDLEIHGDFSNAKKSDHLKDTINYEAVYAFLRSNVTQKTYYLLEALANAVAEGLIREFPIIHAVTVTVRKWHPPIKGVIDYVEVEVHEGRS